MSERDFAIAVVRRLREAGHQALWAGGCVRDELLGLVPDDFDVATDARPEEVARLFRRTVAVGVSFGVIQVLGPREDPQLSVEVATFRSDGAYIDGRRPESVTFSSPQEDAQRRDFTINGLFFDPLENRLIDFVGGQADLEARLLRAIGDPRQRFSEDKLRLLRGIRISARFGFEIEPGTLDAIRAMADQIAVVSAERITDELRKMLLLPKRAHAMSLLMDLGLARAVLPETVPLRSLPVNSASKAAEDSWEHTLRALANLGNDASFTLAFACLLHGVGKQVDQICRRLKLSVADRETVAWLVDRRRILCDARSMPVSKLKRILASAGVGELLALHRAIALAEGQQTNHVEYCEQLLAEWSEAELNPPALVTGHDLEGMGLQPGPVFKELLELVRDAQLEGVISTREGATALLLREVARRAAEPGR
jgi:poly(A) polymerase